MTLFGVALGTHSPCQDVMCSPITSIDATKVLPSSTAAGTTIERPRSYISDALSLPRHPLPRQRATKKPRCVNAPGLPFYAVFGDVLPHPPGINSTARALTLCATWQARACGRVVAACGSSVGPNNWPQGE